MHRKQSEQSTSHFYGTGLVAPEAHRPSVVNNLRGCYSAKLGYSRCRVRDAHLDEIELS